MQDLFTGNVHKETKQRLVHWPRKKVERKNYKLNIKSDRQKERKTILT